MISPNDLVAGNRIGDSVAGAALPDTGDGLDISSSSDTIGGSATGDGNVISGNGNDGIDLSTVYATGNVIEGNVIGTDVTG